MKRKPKIIIIGISIIINLFILKVLFPGIYSPITNLFLEECTSLKIEDIKKLNSFFKVDSSKGDYKYWCSLDKINTYYYNAGSNSLSEVSLKHGNELPVELGKLINLRKLELSNQYLTGKIPKEFGGLVNLKKLDLSNNNLSGEIPKDISLLKNLEDLILFKNQFTGELPIEIAELKKLNSLDISNNQFTGEFPTEIIELKNLDFLYLTKNNFTGNIPEAIIKR